LAAAGITVLLQQRTKANGPGFARSIRLKRAMLVHRSPQPVCDTTENDAHLVQMPTPASPRFTVAQRFGQVGTELHTPDTNRSVADVDASLEQQLLHVPVREQEAVVKVHRVGDDQLREAVALGSFTRLVYRVSLPDVK